MESIIDQLAAAVRLRLIAQGFPFESGKSTLAAATTQNLQQFKPIEVATLTPEKLAGLIDHTLLKPDATREEIRKLCEEARQYRFAAVCVNSSFIPLVTELLSGSAVLPIAVVGFPLGAASSTSKAFEAKEAILAGAREIDMVIAVGALKNRDYSQVLEDIRQVAEVSKPFPVKVILETSNLTQDEKVIGCALAKAAGASFVKTSTGFGAGGATPEDVSLMRGIVGDGMGVKASGGIRTYNDAIRMIQAGANRIGASAGIAIVSGAAGNSSTQGGY